MAGLVAVWSLRGSAPLFHAPPLPDSPGAVAPRDRAERPDAPEVLPTGPYPGPRQAVALPAAACSPFGDSSPAIESFLTKVDNGARVEFPERGVCLVTHSLDLGVPPRG